ncbi:hypothetical protein BC832DRAFT_554910 [Gaertneriomyces semiglobifer]|nr:hypothetical protein BC832DRAFT_554910 [Gaertneriomyces semiglobifer]
MEVHPRVNSAILPKCKGATVRLMGKILGVNIQEGEALIEACDQGQVTVRLLTGSLVGTAPGGVVEILGKVDGNDLSIQEMSSTLFNNVWNPDAYNKMVLATMEHNEMFGWWN